MPWKPWIETEPDDTANEAVRQLYSDTLDRITKRVPDGVRLTSLTPKVSRLINDLNRAVHSEAEGLSAREQEVAGLIVASYNGCVH